MSLKDKYQVNNVFVSAVTPENISRQQLLAWVNDSLQIEEMSTGAAYCMLTDRLFPGSIPMHKVKWNSKSDLDYLANWKLVQNSWHDLGITKPVQVQTLMKGKFQDNFEFLQWFRRFYDFNNAGYEYDPLAARNNQPFPSSTGIRSGKAPAPRVPVSTAVVNRRTTVAPASTAPAKPTPSAAVPRKSMAPTARPATTAANTAKSSLSAQQETKYRTEIAELKDQISTWEKTLNSVEQERDYYYKKLHKVELLCNEHEGEQTIKVDRILSILYKEEEDDGGDLQAFEAVEEKILHDEQTISNGVHAEDEAGDNTVVVEDSNVANIIDLGDSATDDHDVTQVLNGAANETIVLDKTENDSYDTAVEKDVTEASKVEEAPEHHETNSAEHHGTKSTEHNETKSVEGNSSSQLNESAATNNEHVLKADDTTFGLESSAVLKTETSF